MDTYKYLGYHINEHLSHSNTVQILTKSAKRAFGKVVNCFKKLGNMGRRTFDTLYNSNILPIANYASGVWGFKEFRETKVLQNKIGRFYLGTHRFTPLAATCTEMDWMDIRQVRWMDMARLKNRIVSMDHTRWPKKVWEWDVMTKTDAWFSDICFILDYAELDTNIESISVTDLDNLARTLHAKNRKNWELEAFKKTKLETFVQIHDFSTQRTVLKSNLERRQRSLVIKLKSGVFPVKKETGRYKGLARELRICDLCNTTMEDEIHFLFQCSKLNHARKAFIDEYKLLVPGFDDMSDTEKLALWVSPDHVRKFAKWLEFMTDVRRDQMYR